MILRRLFATLLLLFLFSASVSARDLRVLTTFLPVYVFTRNVAKDVPGVRVDVLMGVAVSPHDYQLSPGDARKIISADALIANGYIEEFLGDSLKRIKPDLRVLESGKAVKPIKDADSEHGHGRGSVNPHTWVGPAGAVRQVLAIRDFLSKIDPTHKKLYAKNAAAYAKELNALKEDMISETKKFPARRIVTFHNAFDYFARDVGLEVVGYIEATPGQDPSAGDIMNLIRTIRKTRARAVFSEPQYSSRLAKVVAREAGVPVGVLDPMGQTSLRKIPDDLYQRVMRKNLETLQRMLEK